MVFNHFRCVKKVFPNIHNSTFPTSWCLPRQGRVWLQTVVWWSRWGAGGGGPPSPWSGTGPVTGPRWGDPRPSGWRCWGRSEQRAAQWTASYHTGHTAAQCSSSEVFHQSWNPKLNYWYANLFTNFSVGKSPDSVSFLFHHQSGNITGFKDIIMKETFPFFFCYFLVFTRAWLYYTLI